MAVEIEALELSITHESKGATNSIGKLISALTHLKQACSGGAGLGQVVSQLKQLHQALSSANSAGATQALASTQKSANAAATAVQQASRQVTELSSGLNEMRTSASTASNAVSEIKNNAQVSNPYVAALARQLERLKDAQSSLSKRGQTFGYLEYDRNARAIAIMTAELKAYQKAATGTSGAARELKESIKSVGASAKSSATGMGKFATSLKRIFLYRAIRAILSAIVRALKEGITNLYEYSRAVNNTDPSRAAATMDAYASAVLRVKNSIAAALMPIIAAALPLIQTITNAIITALNAFNMFVSALTGKSTYLVAAENTSATFGGIESGASGAAGAVKELKRQLMGFDELNILENPDSGGGGGGGGGSGGTGINAKDMFDPVQIDPEYLKKINEFLEPITSAIEKLKAAWDKFAGSTIGRAIIDALKFLGNLSLSVAIERVGDAINYVASAIELIAMILDPSQFEAGSFFGNLGDMLTTVGEVASLPQYLGLSFVNQLIGNLFGIEGGVLDDETIRLIAMGLSPTGGQIGLLGEAIKAIGRQLGGDLAKAFVEGFNEYLGTNFKSVDQNSISKKLYDETGNVISTGQKKASDSVWSFLGISFDEEDGAGGAIKNWYNEQIAPWFTQDKWQSLGTSAKDAFKSSFIWTGINNVRDWYDEKVRPYFKGENGKAIWQKNGSNPVAWFKSTFVWKGITTVRDWYHEKVWPYFKGENAKSIWQKNGSNPVAWFKSTFVWKGITTVATWYKDNVKPWFEKNVWQKLGGGILPAIRDSLQLKSWNPIKEWWNSNIAPWFTWSRWRQLGLDALNALVQGIRSIYIPTFHLSWEPLQWNNGKTIQWLRIPKLQFYAQGGYDIPSGQLFVANEAGPELVGQMNGHNAVANQGQIVEGIRQGVYDAVVSAFANNGGQSNHITVKVGEGTLADVVTRALNNQTRRLGYSQLEGI